MKSKIYSRSFGIEYEYMSKISHHQLVQELEAADIVVDHYATEQASCPEKCYSGWQVKTDGSITLEGPYNYAVELVTPPLTLKKLPEIRKALAIANKTGKINSSCGLHIHVHAPELVSWLQSAEHIAIFSTMWGAIEAVMFTYMPPSRRRHDLARPGIVPGHKYQAMNISPLADSGKQTIEFRLHSGTLNVSKSIAFTTLCLAFVEAIVHRQRIERIQPTDVISVPPKKIVTKLGTEFYLIRDDGKWHIESKNFKELNIPNLNHAYKEFKKPLGITAKSYLSAFQYPHYGNAMGKLCSTLNVNGIFRGYLEDRYDMMLTKHGPANVTGSTTTLEDEDDYYNEPEYDPELTDEGENLEGDSVDYEYENNDPSDNMAF